MALPSINSLIMGEPAKAPEFAPRYGQQGINALNQLFSSGTSSLQNPNAGFEPFAQQARSEFFGKSLPGLAERFSRYPGQQSSSAYRNALGSAAGEFEQGLASAASQYGLQNRQQGVRELMAALTPEFLSQLTPEKKGLIEQLLPSFIESVPGLIGTIGGLATGGTSTAISSIISLLGNLLSSKSSQPTFSSSVAQANAPVGFMSPTNRQFMQEQRQQPQAANPAEMLRQFLTSATENITGLPKQGTQFKGVI